MIKSGHERASSPGGGEVVIGTSSSSSPRLVSTAGLKARHRTVVASGNARHRCSNSLYARVILVVCSQERRPITPKTLRWLCKGASGEVTAEGEFSGRKRKCMFPVFHGKNLNGLFWDSL